MTLGDWARNTREYFDEYGAVTAAKASASEFYVGAALRAFDRVPRFARTNVMGEPWDMLIVLDACRLDALREVAPEFGWLPEPADIGYIRSTGSMSEEWMQETFTTEHVDAMADTAHVTWNAYAHYNTRRDEWAHLDQVWKDSWDDDLGQVPADVLTERAVAAYRHAPGDRLLVHYQQPHTPYPGLVDLGVVEPLSHERVGDKDHYGRKTVWKALRAGEITHAEAWGAYLDTLRGVLDEVDRLRHNVDGRVVLTADHGDCFGEWGGMYGHPRGVPVPELIKVPWVEIPASDERTVDADLTATKDADTETAHRRLEALGYV